MNRAKKNATGKKELIINFRVLFCLDLIPALIWISWFNNIHNEKQCLTVGVISII